MSSYGHVTTDPKRKAVIIDGLKGEDMLQWIYYNPENCNESYYLEPICRHATEWKTIPGQYTHPHPVADPSGKWIMFTAAKNLRSDLFVVDVK